MNLELKPITKSLSKSPFDCGYPVLNQYLRLYALKNDRLSIGKTFIAVDPDSSKIAGYLTVSTAQMTASDLPENIRTKLPRYPVPAFRIGKLAVSLDFQGKGGGRWLLFQALQKALQISESVGLFAVIVDAIDKKAKAFYLKFGFVPFWEYPLTLFLPIETIRKSTQ